MSRMPQLWKSAFFVAAGIAVALALSGTSSAQKGIDPLNAPDWLPPLKPPKDGEIAPPLPEVVAGLVILPEKRLDPDSEIPDIVDPSAPAPDVPNWYTNPKKAHNLAKETGKYHMMALTGLEWNTQPNASVLLRDDILNTPAFSEFSKDKFVLSYIDYSRNPNDWSDRHEQIKAYYGVKGFPTLIIFDNHGKQVGKVAGYRATADQTERKFLFRAELTHLLKTDEEAKQHEIKTRERMLKDGYRDWQSAKGSTLFAKLVRANAKLAVFEDEERKTRKVELGQLSLGDRELVKRMVLAREVPTKSRKR
jgi:thiol-disulfide isomerase/thioredoxin